MAAHPVNILAQDARALRHMGPTDQMCREAVIDSLLRHADEKQN